jgi:GTP:adenosylcobinamide-phosphate guanylyltransferase
VSVTAIVLGGGDADDLVAQQFGVPVKALAIIAGQPMAAYVLRALRSGGVERIIYVGPLTPMLEGLIDAQVAAQGTMLENLQAGLAEIGDAKRVLVATADIPLLTGEAVRDVLARDSGAGLVYPVIDMVDSQAMFPTGKRTSAKLREGRFTGGNLFLLEPRLVGDFLPRLEFVLSNRKNVLRLAGMFGVGALVKLALGTLQIAELEASVSRILGVPAQALITKHAEVSFDVDKLEDIAIVLQKLEPA